MRSCGRCQAASVIAVVALLAACGLWRRSAMLVRQQQTGVSFYADLGQDFIDVSGYPPQQRLNYAAYARVCSECHTLARSINSPVASRKYWEMYVQGMRRRSLLLGEHPLSKAEAGEIVDFLEFDSEQRKIVRKAEFEAQTRKLEERFDELMSGAPGS